MTRAFALLSAMTALTLVALPAQVRGAAGAPTLTGLSVSPVAVVGGKSSKGQVTLSGKAASDVVVTVSADKTGVSVPNSVTIHAGQTSASFTINTSTVGAMSITTISAKIASVGGVGASGGAARTARLTMNPPPMTTSLAAISVKPAAVVGGASVQATVRLTSALTTPTVVIVNADSTNVILPSPNRVTVPANQTSASVTLKTNAVAVSVKTTLTANLSGGTVQSAKTTTLTLNPPPTTTALAAISVKPAAVVGGASVQATVRLTNALTTPTIVILTADSTNVILPSPNRVTVPANQTSASVTLKTNAVAVSMKTTLTANLSGGTVQSAKTTTLTLNPPR